jgi:ATP-GRASP peptide maturase of grasp-with-spasm system
MLLILSDEFDITTNDVIDWLDHLKISFLRINDTHSIAVNSLKINNEKTSWNITVFDPIGSTNRIIDSEEIKSFWYRRGKFVINNEFDNKERPSAYWEFNQKLKNFISKNNDDLIRFLYNNLKDRKHLGFFYDNYTQKLQNLVTAQKLGLQIPSTQILNDKKSLISFLEQYGKCITKGINENGVGIKNKIDAGCLTQLINKTDLKNIPELFSNSLVQEYIEKLFELRIFYINGECYSSAIFSQLDEMTKIDFRNYNYDSPNRIVPFMLPKFMKNKIVRFMNRVNMKTGSLDVLVSTKMEYYFLEVNPIGQFSWFSKKCNYNIENAIAKYLNFN